jgi:hypothetical protein
MINEINAITEKITNDCKESKTEFFRIKHFIIKYQIQIIEISIFNVVQNEQAKITLNYRISGADMLVWIRVPKVEPSFEVVLTAEVLHSLLINEIHGELK